MKRKYQVELANGEKYIVDLECVHTFTEMNKTIIQDAKERGFKAKVTGWEMVDSVVDLDACPKS